MNQSAGGPPSGPKAVHERIAKALAAQSDPRLKTIAEISVYARRHLPEHAAAGESMNENIINDAILPFLDVAVLKEAASPAELPFMPLVRKAAHAWSWEHPGRNSAALRFIAAAERYHIGRDGLPTPWRVRWANPVGASEILGRTGSIASLAAVRLDEWIVAITASRRGRAESARIEMWDLETGQSRELLDQHQSADVSALAAESAPDGSAFVSAASTRGLVRCWRIWRETDAQGAVRLKYEPMRSFDLGNAVTALAVAVINGRPHILAGHNYGNVSLLDHVSPRDEYQRPLPPREIQQGRVTGIECVRLSDGTPAAVSVSDHGMLRVSSLLSQLAPVGSPAHPGGTIRRIAAVRSPDGTSAMAVTAGEGGSVRIWDLPPSALPPPGEPRSRQVPGHDQEVVVLAAGTEPAGQPIVVTGDSAGRLRFVDPVRAAILGGPVEAHRGRVAGLALCASPDGRSVVVSGDDEGTVRTWDLPGALSGDPLGAGRPAGPGAAPLAAAAPADEQAVRVWRLADGMELGVNVGARPHRMVAVAAGRLADGTRVAVTDPGGRQPPEPGRGGQVVAVATAVLPDRRAMAVTADDNHLQFWELRPGPTSAGDPPAHPGVRPVTTATRAPHPGARLVVTAVRADGRPVAVSAGRDHALQAWDMEDGRRLDRGRAELDRPVTALATVAAPGRPAVVLSGSADSALRAWTLQPFDQVDLVYGRGRQIAAVAGVYTDDGLVAVTAWASDPVVRKWGLLGADPGPPRLTGHEGPVTAVAIGGPAEQPVVITAGEDRTVRVWDLMSSTQVVDPMPVPGTVRAIACFDDDGPSAVIAGDDVLAVVRWDGREPRRLGFSR